jgi:hypothetical protein
MITPVPNRGKEKRGDVTIMLLGSYERLRFRRKVKQELLEMGFKGVIIMEDLQKDKKNLDYGSLDEKFESIVKEYNPKLFVAIFHKKAVNFSGVIFEIGWLCGRLRSKAIHTKLRFLFEMGYNLETSAYIKALFTKVPRLDFDESNKYDKCSELIRTILVPMIK